MATFPNLNAILDSDLSRDEKLVLMVFELCTDGTARGAYPSARLVAQRASIGLRSARRAIASLKQKHLLTDERWTTYRGSPAKHYNVATPATQAPPCHTGTPLPHRPPTPATQAPKQIKKQTNTATLPHPPLREGKVDRLVRVMLDQLDGEWPDEWDPDDPASVMGVVSIAKGGGLSGRLTDVEEAMRLVRQQLLLEAAK